MSWKDAIYGDGNITTLNLLCITMALGFYGAWADFIPSLAWAEIGLSLAIAVTMISISIYYWALFTGRAKVNEKASPTLKAMVILLLPAIAFALAYLAVIHGVGAIATQALGKSTELTTELSKRYVQSRKSCEYRLEGPFLAKAFPNYICISESKFSSLPETTKYTLKVNKTKMATHIKNLTALPAINKR